MSFCSVRPVCGKQRSSGGSAGMISRWTAGYYVAACSTMATAGCRRFRSIACWWHRRPWRVSRCCCFALADRGQLPLRHRHHLRFEIRAIPWAASPSVNQRATRSESTVLTRYRDSAEVNESRGADSLLRSSAGASKATAAPSAVHIHARRPLSLTMTRASPYLDSRLSTVDTEANGSRWCINNAGFRRSISCQTS